MQQLWGLRELLLSSALAGSLVLRHHPVGLLLCLGLAGFMLARWYSFLHLERVGLGALALLLVALPLWLPVDPMARIAVPDMLGADELGRDQLARLFFGARTSIFIAFAGSFGALALSLVFVTVRTFAPSPVQFVVQTLLQVWLATPVLVVVLLGRVLLAEGGAMQLAFLIAIALWPEPARLLEERYEALREAPFVQTARMLGCSSTVLVWREILPNLKPTGGVAFLMAFTAAILMEAVLGFLGLGLAVGHPSLGQLIEASTRRMDQQPGFFFACMAMLLVWVYGLRKILDRAGASNPPLRTT